MRGNAEAVSGSEAGPGGRGSECGGTGGAEREWAAGMRVRVPTGPGELIRGRRLGQRRQVVI